MTRRLRFLVAALVSIHVASLYGLPFSDGADGSGPHAANDDDVIFPAFTDGQLSEADEDSSPPVPASEPIEVVLAAIDAESRGQLAKRDQLLGSLGTELEFANAMLGKMSDRFGHWNSVDEAIRSVANDPKLARYYQSRDAIADTPDDHWQLARWCQRNGLQDQARAHSERVILLSPDHTKARRALGYVRVGQRWISPENIKTIRARDENSRMSMRRYGHQVLSIAGRLQSPSQKVRQKAIEDLQSIDDPMAGPAIGNVLVSMPSSLGAVAAIDWFAKLDSAETSRSLCWFALFHPNQDIREQAADHLRDRPLHDFVPDLLNTLATEIDASLLPVLDRNGRFVGMQNTFTQQGLDTQRIQVIEEIMVGQNRRTGPIDSGRIVKPKQLDYAVTTAITNSDNPLVEQIARTRAENDADETIENISQRNRIQQNRNDRISDLLSQITGKDFSGSPQAMWRWWDDVNEIELQKSKYTLTSHIQLDTSNDTYQRENEIEIAQTWIDRTRPRCECFVAGTPVMTQRGARPIESIVPGDLVLSRNIQTGTLQWKPVFQSTLRPPTETLIISLSGDEFQCTPGHLFWVSGSGWKKASELEVDDVLHAAARPQKVVKITQAQRLQTHNLMVADNANYFVGKHQILAHDVTMRKPNRQPFPGYQLVTRMAK